MFAPVTTRACVSARMLDYCNSKLTGKLTKMHVIRDEVNERIEHWMTAANDLVLWITLEATER